MDDTREVMGEVTAQMHQREDRLLNDKVDRILQERRLLRENKKQMVQDQYHAATDKMLKKLEFISVNDRLKEAKVRNAEKELGEKAQDRLSFFPFTHGETVEKHRALIKEDQKAELHE